MKLKKLFGLLAALMFAFAVVSCGEQDGGGDKPDNRPKNYTYSTFTSTSPSNWNELTYQDNNDTQIMSYIGSSFFQFDYKFENGEIVDGQFEVEYSAATNLEDVSAEYVGEQYNIKADEKYRAYKITLRQDLKWDDGTPIYAGDFVYTMKEQLDPKAKHYRADSFYVGGTIIHNAENYVKQGTTTDVSARKFYETWDPTAEDVFFDLGSASTVGNWVEKNYGSYLSSHTAAWVVMALGAAATEEQILSLYGKTPAQIYADETLKDIWTRTLAFWQTDPNEELDFFAAPYTYPVVEFDQVGIFEGDNRYELVLILEKPLQLLNEDGSLNYKAAYNSILYPCIC
jgi:ABC-type transport system substrate-binding protein